MKIATATFLDRYGFCFCLHYFNEQLLRRILKPRLTASEACHRLVLSKGQKENKMKKVIEK